MLVMVKLSASPELSVRSQFIPKVLLNDCNAQDSLNIEGFNIYIYMHMALSIVVLTTGSILP